MMNEQYCNSIVDNIVHAGQLNVAVTNNNAVRFYVYVYAIVLPVSSAEEGNYSIFLTRNVLY